MTSHQAHGTDLTQAALPSTRSLLLDDPAAGAARLGRDGVDPQVLMDLLRARTLSRPSAGMTCVEFPGGRGERAEMLVRVPTHRRGQSLGVLLMLHGLRSDATSGPALLRRTV